MKVRILVSWLGTPGTVVEMDDQEAVERIASGEVEPVGRIARRRASADIPEERAEADA